MAQNDKVTEKTFAEIIADVSAGRTKKRISDFETAFDARMAHETQKAAGNTSIQKVLKAEKAKLTTPALAALSLAAEMSPDFVNRVSRGDARFNVYAIKKITDLMNGLNGQAMRNAINIAIIKSMLACEKAGVPFTGQIAQAAVSDKLPLKKELDAIMTRHNVGASTAPTQASSTMNALMMTGVARNTGTTRNPVYELKATPQTEVLRTMFAA